MVAAAYPAGLGARWPFLSDESRTAMRALGILDATEGEYPDVSRPFTFVRRPDLTVHRVYEGWFFVGRPSIDELRHDVREVFEGLPMYPYEAYDTERVKRLRTGRPLGSGTTALPPRAPRPGWSRRSTSGRATARSARPTRALTPGRCSSTSRPSPAVVTAPSPSGPPSPSSRPEPDRSQRPQRPTHTLIGIDRWAHDSMDPPSLPCSTERASTTGPRRRGAEVPAALR